MSHGRGRILYGMLRETYNQNVKAKLIKIIDKYMSRKVSRRPALRLLDHQGQAQTPSSSDIATSNQFVCEPWSRTA